MSKTPLIAARVPRERQEALNRIAEAEGRTITDLVNEAIEALIEQRSKG